MCAMSYLNAQTIFNKSNKILHEKKFVGPNENVYSKTLS